MLYLFDIKIYLIDYFCHRQCFLRFQASAHLDLGVRAGQKLREMARREEEEEVKTKVRQIQ